jgi:hypothetical protein
MSRFEEARAMIERHWLENFGKTDFVPLDIVASAVMNCHRTSPIVDGNVPIRG